MNEDEIMEEQMMGSMDLGASVDDIEEPVLLPEGWYMFEIVPPPPTVRPNQVKVNDPASPDAADNWVVNLSSVHEDPMFSGRRFTVWLGVPKPGDDERWNNRGQRVDHAKMDRAKNFTLSFEGELLNGPSGPRSRPVVRVGKKGMAYVLQQMDNVTRERTNRIDPFGKFKPVLGEGGEGSLGSSDDIPF